MSMKIGFSVDHYQEKRKSFDPMPGVKQNNALIIANTMTMTAADAFGEKSGDHFKQQYGMSLQEAKNILNDPSMRDPRQVDLAKAILEEAKNS